MKKILSLVFLLIFVVSCGDDSVKILEPNVSADNIDFPKEKLKDGKFTAIYRNNTEESVSISLLLISKTIIDDSNSVDFCEGVDALRNGKQILEWTPINYNLSITPETSVINANDHPNFVSYNLPVGTYIIMTMDSDSCNEENYSVFDVQGNKSFEGEK